MWGYVVAFIVGLGAGLWLAFWSHRLRDDLEGNPHFREALKQHPFGALFRR